MLTRTGPYICFSTLESSGFIVNNMFRSFRIFALASIGHFLLVRISTINGPCSAGGSELTSYMNKRGRRRCRTNLYISRRFSAPLWHAGQAHRPCSPCDCERIVSPPSLSCSRPVYQASRTDATESSMARSMVLSTPGVTHCSLYRCGPSSVSCRSHGMVYATLCVIQCYTESRGCSYPVITSPPLCYNTWSLTQFWYAKSRVRCH